MNDAIRETYLELAKKVKIDFFSFEAGWQAAFEWSDSQVGEPYLWMTEWWIKGGPDNGEYEYETSHINEFSCGRKNGFPLYRQPPAAQINQQLVEALEAVANEYIVMTSDDNPIVTMVKSALAAAKNA